jgi:hypothetical protein
LCQDLCRLLVQLRYLLLFGCVAATSAVQVGAPCSCSTRYLISRVIQRHGPPTPATIRQLTIAIPRARMIWALPFWQPNKSQYAAMDRILTLPLRSALHLPRSTSRAALFSEYGLANLQLTREYQQLAYANRLLGRRSSSSSLASSSSASSPSLPLRIQLNHYWKPATLVPAHLISSTPNHSGSNSLISTRSGMWISAPPMDWN